MVSASQTETDALDKAARNTLRLVITLCRCALEDGVAELVGTDGPRAAQRLILLPSAVGF